MNAPALSPAPSPATPRAAHLVYAFLLAATGLTWFLGETGAAGPAVMAVLMLAGHPWWATVGLAVVMAFSCMPKYTAERLLDHIAITLSGAEQAFKHSS